MKTNLWIWILTILLILTFFALCAGISLAQSQDETTLYIIVGALGVLLLIIVIIIFSILNKSRRAD